MPLTGLVLGLMGACSAPPEAPEDFDALGSFIFQHAADEETGDLAKGIENLQTWLEQHREEIGDGMVIDNLDPAVVEHMESEAIDVTEMIGVGYVHTYTHKLERIYNEVLSENTEPQMHQDGRVRSKRTYLTDRACFLDGSCETVGYHMKSINDYPLGLEATVEYEADVRWVDTKVGRAVILRNWLVAPSTFNWAWLDVPLSYYLSIAVETEPGCVERTEVTWILANFMGAPIPIDVGISLAIDTIINNAVNLEQTLDSQPN